MASHPALLNAAGARRGGVSGIGDAVCPYMLYHAGVVQACAVPMHEEDGLHRVWACMTRAGLTRVCATVSGCRVNGIPLTCDILPGPPDYAASQLIGPGIGSLAVGSLGTVSLKVHDAFRNAVDDAAVPEDVQRWEVRPPVTTRARQSSADC